MTLLRTGLLALSVLGLAACSSQPDYRSDPADPQTVAQVDIDRYAGRWHEIARYPNRFQKGCAETTADYSLQPDGTIRVINSCRLASGEARRAEGRARVIAGSGGAKLKVRFAPGWVPFAEGDYWIVYLEPDYSLAVVSDRQGKYLWILARVPDPPAEAVARALDHVRQAGFETDPLVFATGTVAAGQAG